MKRFSLYVAMVIATASFIGCEKNVHYILHFSNGKKVEAHRNLGKKMVFTYEDGTKLFQKVDNWPDTTEAKFIANKLANSFQVDHAGSDKLNCQFAWWEGGGFPGYLPDTTDLELPDQLSSFEVVAIQESWMAKARVSGWQVQHVHRRNLLAGYRLEACIKWPKRERPPKAIDGTIIALVP